MTSSDDGSHLDDEAHWALANGPENSVDLRRLALVLDDRYMVVAMSKGLFRELQIGTSNSLDDFAFVVREMISFARRVNNTADDVHGADSVRYEVAPEGLPMMFSGRVLIENYAHDWPDRLWICYPRDSLANQDGPSDA